MKKIIKFLILIVLFIFVINSNVVYATPAKGTDGSGGGGQSSSSSSNSNSKSKNNKSTTQSSDWKDGFKYADDFTNGQIDWNINDKNLTANEKEALEKRYPSVTEMEKNMKKDLNSIFNLLLAIGTALTVIVGAVLGISYIMASAEDKAKIKEKMIPYIVGSIVIFGAYTIWFLVVTILGKMN